MYAHDACVYVRDVYAYVSVYVCEAGVCMCIRGWRTPSPVYLCLLLGTAPGITAGYQTSPLLGLYSLSKLLSGKCRTIYRLEPSLPLEARYGPGIDMLPREAMRVCMGGAYAMMRMAWERPQNAREPLSGGEGPK